MVIKKEIMKIGTSLGVILDKIIIESYNIEEGDFLDLSDIKIIKRGSDDEIKK